MAKPYLLFFILLATACTKDIVTLPDYYIEFDETMYTPSQKDKSFTTWCNSNYCGAAWNIETKNHTLNYTVHNTCDDHWGTLSNFRGEVKFETIENNKVLEFVAKRPLFEYKTIDGKRYFEFKDLKCYLQVVAYDDSTIFKTVSGRVLRP